MANKRYNYKKALSITLGLVLSSLSIQAFSGIFSVTPVRIYMAQRDRAVAVTIINDGDTELVMQADLYLWKQKEDGQDDLILTEDMFLAPPIIKMAPKSKQVVRLARLSPSKSPEQLTYRMIVREIPEANKNQADAHLQIALAFSMPVFITPVGAKSNLKCHAERLDSNNMVAACTNDGTAYAHPVDIELVESNAKILENYVGGYILPHMSRQFKIKSDKDPIASGSGHLILTLDDGTTEKFDINIPQ